MSFEFKDDEEFDEYIMEHEHKIPRPCPKCSSQLVLVLDPKAIIGILKRRNFHRCLNCNFIQNVDELKRELFRN